MALSIRKKHKIIGGAGLLASLGFFTAMNSVSLFSSPIAKADAINDVDFVIKVKTDNAGVSTATQFTIPATGAGHNYTVDCNNDGTLEAIGQTTSYTCNYATAGEYTIRIGGAFPQIYFNNAGDKLKLLEINQWGDKAWRNFRNSFYGCSNLEVKATDIPDLSGVASLSSMFRNASSLTGTGANWSWVTTNITDMSLMFAGATMFDQPVDAWDTSKVTNMSSMFAGATAFNQPVGAWDVSKVTNMTNMFSGATVFDQPLNSWVTTSLTLIPGMFQNATVFNQPLDNWSVSNVTSMSDTFNAAKAFNQPLDSWNVGNVITMRNMFRSASSFNSSLLGWDTSKVTNMYYMFAGATSFNQPVGGWDVSNVTNMARMFEGCNTFNQPLDTWDVGKVTDMNSIFSGNYVFNQPLNSWNTSSLNTTYGMFSNARAFNQPLDNWNTANVTNMGNTFFSAWSFNQPLNSWNTSKVTNTYQMFEFAYSFNQPLDSWDTSKVTTMRYMFAGADSFDQSLASWDVSSITQATNMFAWHQLSTVNYDLTLRSWSLQGLQPNVLFSGGNSTYCLAEAERDSIINTDIWTITDAGMDCSVYKPNSLDYSGIGDFNENVTVPLSLGAFDSTDDIPVEFTNIKTYSLECQVPGANDSFFSIAGDQLILVSSPDFEASPQLNVCVRVTNSSGEYLDKIFTFIVNDLLSVGYDGNGSTGGVAPGSVEAYSIGDAVTVANNTGSLVKQGFVFDGWNTMADGSGIDYTPGSNVSFGATDIKLFAKWLDSTPPNPATLTTTNSTSASPELSGLVDDPSDVVTITIGDKTYTAINNGDGTWTLPAGSIYPELSLGIYSISITTTDSAGNSVTTIQQFELVGEARLSDTGWDSLAIIFAGLMVAGVGAMMLLKMYRKKVSFS